MNQLGKLIKQHRERANLSLSDLAKQTGISKSMLSRMESGERDFPPPGSVRSGLLSQDTSLDIRDYNKAWEIDSLFRKAWAQDLMPLQNILRKYVNAVDPDMALKDVVEHMVSELREYVAGLEHPDFDEDELRRARGVRVGSLLLLSLILAEEDDFNGYHEAMKQAEYRWEAMDEDVHPQSTRHPHGEPVDAGD